MLFRKPLSRREKCLLFVAMLLMAGFGPTILGPIYSSLITGKSIENVKFSENFTGATWDVRVANCIAALPANGPGTCDASNDTTTLTTAGNLTISRANTTLKVGDYTVAEGSNQFIVPVGVHNVFIKAPRFNGSAGGAGGFVLNYTGSSNAVQVGDSTADTMGFAMFGVTVQLTSASTTTAIGVQLNRAINYTLDHLTVYGSLTGGNTQKLVDLEGFANYTGGTMIQPYLNNGCYGIYFGSNANDNTIINPQIPGISGCFGEYYAGGATFTGGNASFGGDIENVSYAYYYDKAEFNRVYGARTEATVVEDVHFTTNSLQNSLSFADGIIKTVDVSGNNSATSGYYTIDNLQLGHLSFATKADVAFNVILQTGAVSEQQEEISYNDKGGVSRWVTVKDTANNFKISNPITAIHHFWAEPAGHTYLQSEGSNDVEVNAQAASGTGGLGVFNGAAGTSLKVAAITGTGGIDNSMSTAGFLKIKDQGSCTMSAGTCSAQTLSHTYASAPLCFVVWNGTGTLTGITKCPSTTTTVTPASSVGTDTAVMNWFVLGS